MSLFERQLHAEIEFWRDMIKGPTVVHSPEAQERMHQALALAEHKLLALSGTDEKRMEAGDPWKNSSSQKSNSH